MDDAVFMGMGQAQGGLADERTSLEWFERPLAPHQFFQIGARDILQYEKDAALMLAGMEGGRQVGVSTESSQGLDLGVKATQAASRVGPNSTAPAGRTSRRRRAC